MKHLILDARAAVPAVDGLGVYLREIVPFLCTEGERAGSFRTTLLVNPPMESFWRAAAPAATLVRSPVRPMGVAQNWQIPRLVRGLKPDLFFYPAHDPPLLLTMPLIFTIHDVTAFKTEPYFERLNRVKTGYLRVVTPAALRRARAIFAVSHTTRREIGDLFGADLLPKIYVTQNGVRVPTSRPLTSASQRDRILYVGTDRPHKNLRRLVQGYAQARARVPDLPRLEIIGTKRANDGLKEIVRQADVEDHVNLRGHVSADELEEAYARALMLVFPSLAEGFGLPILEAMVRGVPVITSNVSGCAEVAGDAALTVDPRQVGEIASGIVRLFHDSAYRDQLVRKGRDRAAEFSWKRSAQQTLAVISDCLVKQ